MKKALTSGIVLLILGVVCGLLLGIVNAFTAPIIQANETREKYESLAQFYPAYADFTIVEVYPETGDIDTIYLLKTGDTVEYAVYSVASIGYKTDVMMMIAVNKDLTVQGYSFIGNSGTEGIGLDIASSDFGMPQNALITDTATFFDGISGATITSNAVKACFDLVAARAASDLGVN